MINTSPFDTHISKCFTVTLRGISIVLLKIPQSHSNILITVVPMSHLASADKVHFGVSKFSASFRRHQI